MKLFIGFDFFGAGNIGDDLMLAGFINILEHLTTKLYCIIPHNIKSQTNRFPQVKWLPYSQINRENIIAQCECWVGVGDTPFQMMSGPWLLKKILNDINAVSSCNTRMYMLGVGAEKEVLNAKDAVNQIVKAMKHIWTRDKFTYDFLVDHFQIGAEDITLGSDLSNISLQKIFSQVNSISKRPYDLAVTYYSEKQNKAEINQLRRFIKHVGKDKSVIFIGNETRKSKHFEWGIYRNMFGGLRKLFQHTHIDYYAPDYEKSSLDNLVKHFQGYEVVMASRYHALLAAAWAGCRLVALPRSSKIESLAAELNIPQVKSPITLESLYGGYERAEVVSREYLKEMAEHAQNAVLDFCHCVNFNETILMHP